MAQNDFVAEEVCRPALENFYENAAKLCLGQPDGFICNGGNAPVVEPTGPVANSLIAQGAVVPAHVVTALTTTAFTSDGSNGGVAWVRINYDNDNGLHSLLIGDVTIQDITPPDSGFLDWQNIRVQTSETRPVCRAVPPGAFIIQNSKPAKTVRTVINGVSIDLLGTLLIQTSVNETIFIALSGQMRIIALGQSQDMVAGQQSKVEAEPNSNFSRPATSPSLPTPFEAYRVDNFPIELLDRPTRLPQPGFVLTEGVINLRSSPSTGASILMEVPADTIMTILGRNPTGDWYHVRLPTGQTGWMFAELLIRNHGVITSVYSATPLPPQRYGDLGTTATVMSPSGVNLRTAPDASFNAIMSLDQGDKVELIARSPYSPWVKVNVGGGIEGWLALITLDTQAIIESLPVDYYVPQGVQPATQPGIWGGAFPDPTCYPNCN